MTVEELSILISASAEDAATQLDTIIQKVATLARMADGDASAFDIKLDTTGAVEQAAELGGAVQAAGDAAEASMKKAQAGAEALAPAMQKAAEGSEPLKQAAEGLEAAGMAAEEAGAAVAKSLTEGNVVAKEFSKTISKMGTSLLQGLVAGGTHALVTLAVGGVLKLVDALAKAKENAEKAAEEMRKQHRETANAMEQERARLNELAASYNALASKPNRSLEETQAMYNLQAQLRSEFGITAGAVDGLAGSYHGLADAIRAAQEAQAGQSKEALAVVASDTGNLALKKSTELYEKLAFAKLALADAQEDLQRAMAAGDTADIALKTGAVDSWTSTVDGLKRNLDALSTDFVDWFTALNEMNAAKLTEAGIQWNDAIAAALATAFRFDLNDFDSSEEASEALYAAVNAILAAMRGTEANEAVEAAQAFHDKLLEGWTPTEEDYEQVSDSYGVLREVIAGALSEITGDTVEASSDAVSEILAKFAPPEALARDWGEFSAAMLSAVVPVNELTQALETLQRRTETVAKLKGYVKVWEDASDAFKKARKGSKEAEAALDTLKDTAKKVGVAFDGTEKDVAAADQRIRKLGDTIDAETTSINAELASLQGQLAAAQANMYLSGAAGLDTSAAAAAIADLEAKIAELVAYAAANGIDLSSNGNDTERRSGGGGGKKKKDDEEAAREAERLRKEAIEADYRRIENKRRLNQITLEEELAMLETLRQKHRMNAEEIMDWEERIYDLKREIAQRDTKAMDTLADGLLDALEARYEAMRDAELARLDESRKGWEAWRDSNVAAIQAQIDALDELTETEDREAQKAEKLRKITSLEQQLVYEQDEYNRAKLQQQLETARKAYDDLVKKFDRADQKDALRDQIKAVEQQADAELDALDLQADEIERLYDERMQAAALRAEAEKLLMSSTQQEIIDLIAAYAPDYNATGKTLGEKLYQGFLDKVGNLTQWFDSFNTTVQGLQDMAAAQAIAAADAFYQQRESAAAQGNEAGTTVVYQTVNYNQPVETPSQAARRLAEANEALAGQLMGVL